MFAVAPSAKAHGCNRPRNLVSGIINSAKRNRADFFHREQCDKNFNEVKKGNEQGKGILRQAEGHQQLGERCPQGAANSIVGR